MMYTKSIAEHAQLSCNHSSCNLLKQGENVVDTSLGGDLAAWLVVARGVALRLAHGHGLDLAVVDDNDEALAPGVAEHSHRARVLEHHADPPSEPALWISHEGESTALCDPLGLCPSRHHGTVVDAEHDNFINTLSLQLRESLQVFRHLRSRSAWREGAGQAQKNHLLVLEALQQLDLFWRETKVQLHIWDFCPNLDDPLWLRRFGLSFGLRLCLLLRLRLRLCLLLCLPLPLRLHHLATLPIIPDGRLVVLPLVVGRHFRVGVLTFVVWIDALLLRHFFVMRLSGTGQPLTKIC